MQLKLQVGQCSDPGLKDSNQDFHGVCVPVEPALTTKGIAVAIADGISSSEVSDIASQTAVRSFLEDYYCTAESWSVKSAVQRVLFATNSWLVAQNQRNQEFRLNKDKGYVCTFSSMVFKSNTAHLFHIGDARIYRVSPTTVEPLTQDHRVSLSDGQSYLGRALGVTHKLEIDYQAIALDQGDLFLLATDGVYEHVSAELIAELIQSNSYDLDRAARKIVDTALANGSADNLTVQIVKVNQLPTKQADELHHQLNNLPFPPALQPRMTFDGYTIVRDLYVSSRSHVVLARDIESGRKVVIKAPSVEGRQDSAYLERFLMEEWVANRLDNPHVVKSFLAQRERNYLYIVTEFIAGQTLAQWMIDNPQPTIETVRGIIEQVAKGLQAFHRHEMLHQDLRPNNIMIDGSGTVKIIDFGSTFVAGINEIESSVERQKVLGTVQFTAPECFAGEFGTRKSDLYSLACIAYQMLSGRLPYGTAAAKVSNRAAQHRLVYQSVLDDRRAIPVWVDYALKTAVHPDPDKRYTELSEFVYDLRHPNRRFQKHARPPLIERNPVLFWQGVSFVLALALIYLVSTR